MLTKRKKEIIELLGKGLKRNGIADELFVSSETVKKHSQNTYKKLKVKNKISALRKMKWL